MARRRRSPEEAKERILDAAEQHLLRAGPSALRLDVVAGELGISRQAILHHFGTRERLLISVVHRALERLGAELARGLNELSIEERASGALIRRTFETLVDGGYGRLLGWLALSEAALTAPEFDERSMEALARLGHGIREQEVGPSEFRDTLFTLVMAAYVILGSAVFEQGVLRSAGLDDDPGARDAFREWFARHLTRHLERAPEP